MSKKIFKANIKCRSCGGSGLYSGMGEGKGVAVQCHTCRGTGCETFQMDYEPFEQRICKTGIRQVFEVNPGVGTGPAGQLAGGMSFSDWSKGRKFERGMEMRSCTCPAWWYQTANYSLKPDWKECSAMGTFSSCPYFHRKSACWERFDKEQGRK